MTVVIIVLLPLPSQAQKLLHQRQAGEIAPAARRTQLPSRTLPLSADNLELVPRFTAHFIPNFPVVLLYSAVRAERCECFWWGMEDCFRADAAKDGMSAKPMGDAW